MVRAWIGTYTGLFKVPVLSAPTFDGTRDVSESFQRNIDDLIDELVTDLQLTVHRLDPSDRNGWVPFVLKTMGLPTEPPQFDLFSSER
jgi:hypothetical protein